MADGITIGLATGDDDTVQQCGTVWAQAVARRDGIEPDVARATGGIHGRLRMRSADLLVAQEGGAVLGFATVVPQEGTLEVFHLACAPDHWGRGVAGLLLDAVEALGRARHESTLRLWVLDDNGRAAAVYRRHGWQPTEDTQDSDGRVERRWVRRST